MAEFEAAIYKPERRHENNGELINVSSIYWMNKLLNWSCRRDGFAVMHYVIVWGLQLLVNPVAVEQWTFEMHSKRGRVYSAMDRLRFLMVSGCMNRWTIISLLESFGYSSTPLSIVGWSEHFASFAHCLGHKWGPTFLLSQLKCWNWLPRKTIAIQCMRRVNEFRVGKLRSQSAI